MKETVTTYGDNQVVGFFKDLAIVYDNEEEKLYCFPSEEIEGMIGACVEKELLEELPAFSDETFEALWEKIKR